MAVNFTGSLAISGSLTATSTITAQTLVVQTITSSVDFVTGSTRFGSIIGNTHIFTGSMAISGGASFNTSQNFTVRSTSTGWISSFVNDYNNTAYIGVDNDGMYFQPTSKGTKVLAGNGTTYLFVTSSGISIGTTNPASNRKLTVAGGAQFTYTDNGGASFNIVPGANGQDGADFNLSYYTGTGYGPLTFTLGGSERMRITSGGDVNISNNSISNSSGLRTLSLYGSATDNTKVSLVQMWNSNAYPVNLIGRTSSTGGSASNGLAIQSSYWNGSSVTTTDRLYIDGYFGSVGIGTTNISSEANLYLGPQGASEGGQLTLQSGTSYVSASHLDNYQNRFRILSGTNTTSAAERFSIDMTSGAISTQNSISIHGGMTLDSNNYSNSITTSWVSIGPTTLFVGLAYVYWANDSSAVRDYALISFNYYPAGVTTISSSNNGGNGVVFQMNGSALQMRTTSGTVIGTQVVWFKV